MDAIYTWVGIARFVAWYGAMIGGLLWLFEGGRALASGNRSRKVVVEILLASAFFLAMGAFAYKMAALVDGSRALLSAPPPVLLEENWGTQFSPDDRERYSRMLASGAFVDHGQIVKYVDLEGVWRQYCPTIEDRLEIQQRAKFEAQLQEGAENGRRHAVGLWLSGFMAFFFGLIHRRVQGAFKKR